MATVRDSFPNSVQLEDLPSPALHYILRQTCSQRTPSICLLSRVCKGLRAAAAAAAVPVHVQLGCHRSPLAGDGNPTLARHLSWTRSSSGGSPFRCLSGAWLQDLLDQQQDPQQQQQQQQQQDPPQRPTAAWEVSAATWLRRNAGIVQSLSIHSEQEDPSSTTALLGALAQGAAAPGTVVPPAPADAPAAAVAAAARGGARAPPDAAVPLRRLQLQGCLPMPCLTAYFAPFQQLHVLHLATPGNPLTFPTTRLSSEAVAGLCKALSGLQHLKRLALQLYVHLPQGTAQQLVSCFPSGLQAVCLHLATPQQVCSSSFSRLVHLQQADLVYVDIVDIPASSSGGGGGSGVGSNVSSAQQQAAAAVFAGAAQQELGLASLKSLSMKCHSPTALVPGARHLQHLQLSGACGPATFKQLASCQQLQSLHLCRLHGPPDVDALSALTQLTRLRLETPGWLPAGDTWCAALAALPALQQVEVNVEALEQVPVATWLPCMVRLEVLVLLFSEGRPVCMEGLQALAGAIHNMQPAWECAGICSLDSCSSSMACASSTEGSSSSSSSSSSGLMIQMGGGIRADSLSSDGTIVSMDWSAEGCCRLHSCDNPTPTTSSSSGSTGLTSAHKGGGLRLKQLGLVACKADPAVNNTSSSKGHASSSPFNQSQAEYLHKAAGTLQLLLPRLAVSVTSDACECPWWLGDEAMPLFCLLGAVQDDPRGAAC